MVSDIPAGDEKMANSFLQCMSEMNPGHQDLQSGALLTQPFLRTLVIGMNLRVMKRAITRDIGILLISAVFSGFSKKGT